MELKRTHHDWGMPGHLTEKQQNGLDELVKKIKEENPKLKYPITYEEQDLLRFLRFRGFNKVQSTFDMLKKHFEWRAEFPENFTKADFPTFLEWHKKRFLYYCGPDKEGRPFCVMKLKEVFPKKLTDLTELLRFSKFYTDELAKLGAINGQVEISGIGDLKDWSLSQNFSFGLVTTMLGTFNDNFPETSGKIYLINLPWSFNVALKMVRPLLDDRIMERVIQVWDKRDLPKILECVDADVLEKEYGGNHEPYSCPDQIIAPLYDNDDGSMKEEELQREYKRNMAQKMTVRMQLVGLFILIIAASFSGLFFMDYKMYLPTNLPQIVLAFIYIVQYIGLILTGKFENELEIQTALIQIPLLWFVVGLGSSDSFNNFNASSVLSIISLLGLAIAIFLSLEAQALNKLNKKQAKLQQLYEKKLNEYKKPKVSIRGYRINDQTNKVEYKVVVKAHDQNELVSWKRYSQFLLLHQDIKKNDDLIKKLRKSMPDKKSMTFNKQSKDFLNKREKELQDYLNAIMESCEDPYNTTEISNFLMLEDIKEPKFDKLSLTIY